MECLEHIGIEYHDVIECIAGALDARDPYTGNHSQRVSEMVCLMCACLALPEEQTEEFHIAAHLHDIGKIGIPDAVLCKSERLSNEEWEVMKKHPQIGADILGKARNFSRIAAIILHHHERYDGKGYPFGAKGEEIPLGARVIAVCDSIDAMCSDRAYRKAMPLDECRAEIERCRGSMYDPAVAQCALDHWDELTAVYRS